METTFKFLKFTRLREIDFLNLSVQFTQGQEWSYSDKFELCKISNFLTRNKTQIDIEDGKTYQRVTAKTNRGGICPRDRELGERIGTKKQFLIKAGQFLVSKIDARNGAFGVVPSECDGAIITGNFWTFDVNTQIINPSFLALITTTKEFVEFAEKTSNGTTNRHYLQEDLFLSQKIPLPSLSVQDQLVADYEDKISRAQTYEEQAKNLEIEIQNYLNEKLGIQRVEKKEVKAKGLLKFVRLKEVERWGIDQIGIIDDVLSSKFQTFQIKNLCSISSGGTPNRSRTDYYKNGIIPWVKTGELLNEILYDTEEKITKLGLENSSAKLYPKGSIVIAMYGATIGKTAKLGIDATTNQACAVLFNINSSIVFSDFLWIFLQSQTDNLKRMAYGGAQPNINAGIIADYKIPIPPFEIQIQIVDQINNLKSEIKQLKTKAIDLRQQALEEFENEIFE